MTTGIALRFLRSFSKIVLVGSVLLSGQYSAQRGEALATPSESPASANTKEGSALNATFEVTGSWPANYIHMPEDGLAFSAFSADGNHIALHFLAPTGEVPKTSVVLGLSVNPAVIDESYIVAGANGYFVVFDRKTGAVLRRKRFQAIGAPTLQETMRKNIWLDGDILTIVAGDRETGTLKRIKLPTLDVIQSIDTPFQGSFVRWRDDFVGIGYLRTESDRIGKPAVVVLDHDFRIIAHAPIDAAASSCDLAGFANPLIHNDLLIFGVECGAIRVFDLNRMQQVAARAAASNAKFLEFAVEGDQLYSVGVGDEVGQSVVTEFDLKTLRPIRAEHISGGHVIASGKTIYAIQNDGDPNHPILPIKTYDIGTQSALALSLNKSVIESQHRAAEGFAKTGDVYAAIGIMNRDLPRLSPADIRELTAEARLRMAWYAGLLVQTHERSAEGLALLNSIKALAPQDSWLGTLDDAAIQWVNVMAPGNGPPASRLGAVATSLTTGVLGGAIYTTPKYLVAALWCGTNGGHESQGSLEPTHLGLTAESEVLQKCRTGAAGIAVYDSRTLSFLLYVPIVSSDEEFQEHVKSVAVIGEVAYAAIERRFEQGKVPTIVSIDLKTGREIARASSGPYDQLRVIAGKLMGCSANAAPPCKQLDPMTLNIIGDGPAMAMPNPFLSDTEIGEMLSRGLGNYVGNAMALTGTQLLVANGGADPGFKSVVGPDRLEIPLAGISGGPGLRGLASPDGKHAYFFVMQAEGHTLVRADFDSERAVTVGDGSFGFPAGIVSIDPFFVDWNHNALEVRNVADGSIVCAWPDLLGRTRDPWRVFLSGDSLVLTASPRGPDDIRPSIEINVSHFIALTRECGLSVQKARQALGVAMARLP